MIQYLRILGVLHFSSLDSFSWTLARGLKALMSAAGQSLSYGSIKRLCFLEKNTESCPNVTSIDSRRYAPWILT